MIPFRHDELLMAESFQRVPSEIGSKVGSIGRICRNPIKLLDAEALGTATPLAVADARGSILVETKCVGKMEFFMYLYVTNTFKFFPPHKRV